MPNPSKHSNHSPPERETKKYVSYTEIINHRFYTGRYSFRPLPFAVDEEIRILKAFKESYGLGAIDDSPILNAMKYHMRETAMVSHLCFRIIFLENDNLTPPEIRALLKPTRDLSTIEYLAEQLMTRIDTLRDFMYPPDVKPSRPSEAPSENTKEAWNYLTSHILDPTPPSVSPSKSVCPSKSASPSECSSPDGYNPTLENLIFKHVLHHDQSPGFLWQDDTYGRYVDAMMWEYYAKIEPQQLKLSLGENRVALATEQWTVANSWKKMGAMLYKARYNDTFEIHTWEGYDKRPERVSAKWLLELARMIRSKDEGVEGVSRYKCVWREGACEIEKL